MGPKKGKGSKLARMSEEERARYLQHRAAIEEEARRRKQQLISTFMKNKLRREEAFTRLNMAKINQQWRQILRDIKTKNLHQNLQNLWQSFFHVMERKDHIANDLLQQLEDLEEMFCKATRFHSEIVDMLIELYKQRLSQLFERYREEKESLLTKAWRLNKSIQERAQDDQDYLLTVTFCIKNKFACSRNITTHKNLAVLDDVKNNMVMDIEKLQNDEELVMESLWKDYYYVLSEYAKRTEPHRSQYARLKERDVLSAAIILEHSHRITALREKSGTLRSQLTNIQLIHVRNMESLRSQREQYANFLSMFRSQLSSSNKYYQQCLFKMNMKNNKTIQVLEALNYKGDQILKLCALCRKLETEEEKVLPFQDLNGSDDKKEKVLEVEEPLAKEMFNFTKLGSFWERYNQVYLERIALALHYEALQLENQQLQRALKHYISDTTEAIASEISIIPLPAVRPGTTKKQHVTAVLPTVETRRRKLNRPVTCIEASTSIAVRNMLHRPHNKI